MDVFEKDFGKLFVVDQWGDSSAYNSGENVYSLQGDLKWKKELPFGIVWIRAEFTIDQIVPNLLALAKKLGQVTTGFPPSSYTSNFTYTGNIINYAIITRNRIKSENPHIFLSKNCPDDVSIIIPVDVDDGSIMIENNGVILEHRIRNSKRYGIFIDRLPIIVRRK